MQMAIPVDLYADIHKVKSDIFHSYKVPQIINIYIVCICACVDLHNFK